MVYFLGGICPSSPPVPPGLGLGCGADDVVVVLPSFPECEVLFELGFEINPNKIKIKFSIVVKI